MYTRVGIQHSALRPEALSPAEGDHALQPTGHDLPEAIESRMAVSGMPLESRSYVVEEAYLETTGSTTVSFSSVCMVLLVENCMHLTGAMTNQ